MVLKCMFKFNIINSVTIDHNLKKKNELAI